MNARLQRNAAAMCAIVALALLAACSGKASLSAQQQSGAQGSLEFRGGRLASGACVLLHGQS